MILRISRITYPGGVRTVRWTNILRRASVQQRAAIQDPTSQIQGTRGKWKLLFGPATAAERVRPDDPGPGVGQDDRIVVLGPRPGGVTQIVLEDYLIPGKDPTIDDDAFTGTVVVCDGRAEDVANQHTDYVVTCTGMT